MSYKSPKCESCNSIYCTTSCVPRLSILFTCANWTVSLYDHPLLVFHVIIQQADNTPQCSYTKDLKRGVHHDVITGSEDTTCNKLQMRKSGSLEPSSVTNFLLALIAALSSKLEATARCSLGSLRLVALHVHDLSLFIDDLDTTHFKIAKSLLLCLSLRAPWLLTFSAARLP